MIHCVLEKVSSYINDFIDEQPFEVVHFLYRSFGKKRGMKDDKG